MHRYKKIFITFAALVGILSFSSSLIISTKADAAAPLIFQYTSASNDTIRATGGPFETYNKTLKQDHKLIDGAGRSGEKVYRSHPDLTISNYPKQCITSITVTNQDQAVLRLLDCNNADDDAGVRSSVSQNASTIIVNKSSEQLRNEELDRDRLQYTKALRDSPQAVAAFCENMQDKSECSNDIGARFQQCWNGHVRSNEFTFPDYNIDLLAGCLASNNPSKKNLYLAVLRTVDDSVKQDNTQSPVPTDGVGSNPSATTTTCNIEGLGWILCPVMTFMAGVTDAAYGFVSSLLEVKPLLITGEDKGIYGAWSVMRNLANIAFVIAFLIIIFSQLTSVGVSNYGIKKLLPRLVVAAILVNISYWICAAAVDFSNVAGSSMKGIFDSLQKDLSINAGDSIFNNGEGWLGFVGGVLAAAGVTAAIMYLHMSILIPALIAAVVAIATVFIVLTLRQALVILLIVIAPLAFVAYLLPNTEDLFNKWRKLLMTLLLMYPIIAGIFGVSALASQVVMTSSNEFPIQVMGALISILPLAITPVVMKFAGGLLNRFGGIVNNLDKGPIDNLRKRGEAYRTTTQNNRAADALRGKRFFGAGYFRRKSRREFRDTAAKDSLSAGNAAFSVTDTAASNFSQVSSSSQLAASAINTAKGNSVTNGLAVNGNQNVLNAMGEQAADNDEIAKALAAQTSKAVSAAIEDVKLSADIKPGDLTAMGTQFTEAVKKGDSIKARAMQDMMLSSGGAGIKEWRKSVSEYETSTGTSINGQVGEDLRKHILDKHPGIKSADASIMGWATDGPRQKLSVLQKEAKTWNITNDEFAGQKSYAQDDAINAGAISQQRAIDITDNDELMSKIDEGVKVRLRAIATTPPTTPPTSTPTPPAP